MVDGQIVNTINFKQNTQEYFSAVMNFALIDKNSEVLVYGKHPQGYQREPEPNHYNKIKDYILNTKAFILPPSIILAVDKIDIDVLLDKSKKEVRIDASKFPNKRKIFRIVDGQHRILAMREAVKLRGDLKDFCFSVIIIVTKPTQRSVEMEVFYNINSKGKRLKVDLIELARFNYRVIEKSLSEKEVNEHISIQTAYYLNEKLNKSVWNNAIKFGIHDEEVIGLIGVNAFRESISGIVDAYLRIDQENKHKNLDGEKLIEYSKKSAMIISDFIHRAWDLSVKPKWEYCFKQGEVLIDLFQEPKVTYYNPKYYLQRTMGAKSINGILSNVVNGKEKENIRGLTNVALKEFDKIIRTSKVSSDDWEVGGTFGGYSSESGFKKVSQFVSNVLGIPRTFK